MALNIVYSIRPCCCKALKHGLDFCPACGMSLFESRKKAINQAIKQSFEREVK